MIKLTEIYALYGGELDERPLLLNERHIVNIRPSLAFQQYQGPLYRIATVDKDVFYVTADSIDDIYRDRTGLP